MSFLWALLCLFPFWLTLSICSHGNPTSFSASDWHEAEATPLVSAQPRALLHPHVTELILHINTIIITAVVYFPVTVWDVTISIIGLGFNIRTLNISFKSQLKSQKWEVCLANPVKPKALQQVCSREAQLWLLLLIGHVIGTRCLM